MDYATLKMFCIILPMLVDNAPIRMQSPTPPHPGKGGDLSQRGCKRRSPRAETFG